MVTGRTMIGSITLAVAIVVALCSPSGATPHRPAGPELSGFPAAFAYSLAHPHADTPGANDWGCTPNAAHPRPVVLVHGTIENRYDNWAELAPRLQRAGYCVFALSYGGYEGTAIRGMTDIGRSAEQLDAFVHKVLARTGADEVDIVGHSQGGMMPRYYLKYLGGADEVHRLIALTPSNYGTSFWGVLPLVHALPGGDAVLGVGAESFAQQRHGSAFLTDLNAGGDTVPGVSYVVITTVYDEVVTPYRRAFLKGPGVRSILLQRRCPRDHTDHLGISYDPIALRLVQNQLDPSTARAPRCRFIPPVIS